MTGISPPPPGQYATPDNLLARRHLHERFGTAPVAWEQWLRDAMDLGDRALELGCGPGRLWKTVPHDAAVFLSDRSTGMAGAARATGLPSLACDAVAIPFAPASFDTVLAMHMLYHVPDVDRALAEVVRVLRPGGVLYAATNGEGHMRDLDGLTGRPPVELSFSLENGAELLGRHFDAVTVAGYDDGLEITETEPAIAYLRSYRDLDVAAVASITAALDEAINRDGFFPVRKSTGLFTARLAG